MSTQFGRPRAAPASAVAKKLVIKPLKSAPKLPPDFADATWARLRAAVLAVQAQRRVESSLEELYRGVEDMCLHKLAAQLYTNLQAECDRHIKAQLAAIAAKQSLDPLLFLQQVQRLWADHCEQMLTIRSIFLYLDRTYVLATTGREGGGGRAPPTAVTQCWALALTWSSVSMRHAVSGWHAAGA